MLPISVNMLSLLVSVGAIAFAIVVALVALRETAEPRKSAARWKNQFSKADLSLSRLESVFSAYPGLVLVWEETIPDPREAWGKPKVYGSTAALASLVRYAEPGDPRAFARNVLDGIADHETVSGSSLRRYIDKLRRAGEDFAVTIKLPGGQLIEADGKTAGPQVVLWLQDASVRSEDARTVISRFQDDRLHANKDPLAFIEMMRNAPYPIWRVTGKGRIEWVNQAYVDAVDGETLETILGGQIQLSDDISQYVDAALHGNVSIQQTLHIVTGGKRRSMSIHAFPISGGAAIIAVDASEAEILRETLTRHIRAHDETLNRMAEGIVIFSSEQKLTFHNTAFAEMFAVDPSWLKQSPQHGELLDHLREKRRLPEQEDFRGWKSSELAYYSDWPEESPDELWSLPDGRTIRLVRMRDPHGGVSLLFEDMTDQMTLQSRFNALIGVQSATLDKLSEGIAVFGPDGRLKVSNAAFAKIWDLPQNLLSEDVNFDLLIDRCLHFYHDRDFWSEMKARTTDPSPEARRHVTGEIKRSDDSILKYLSRPLPDGATLIAWNDETTARKAEAAIIERAEALEAADRLKSEFVGHVSYQLRTPLTTISGYTDLLAGGMAGELEAKQLDYVKSIQTASSDLRKTIDDILDIAAIEADVMDLDLGDVDIYELLNGVMEFVATKAEDTEISLLLECDETIGKIRADERRIKQVVHNLLSNALRFTPSGGHIELGARRVDTGVRIYVKDDGEGIASDAQPTVFESFKSVRGGAGLGLALVQRFVERHGGWVDLESEEGQGTHVTVYLPETASIEKAHPELALSSG